MFHMAADYAEYKFNIHALHWILWISQKVYNGSDVPRSIFILVYLHGLLNSGAQKRKYTFISSDIFYRKRCFFILNLSKVCFEVRKHTLSIVNLKHEKHVASNNLIQ